MQQEGRRSVARAAGSEGVRSLEKRWAGGPLRWAMALGARGEMMTRR